MPASSFRVVCLHLTGVSLLACLVSPGPAAAQDAAPQPATAAAPAAASSNEYRLGPGDRITIGVRWPRPAQSKRSRHQQRQDAPAVPRHHEGRGPHERGARGADCPGSSRSAAS